MTKNAATITCLALLAAGAQAQPCGTYDASLGTFPEDQGWERGTFGDADGITLDLRGFALFQSTLPGFICNDETNNRAGFWQLTDVPFNLNDTIAFEIDLRIIRSEYNTACGTDWPRPGVSFTVIDEEGHLFRLGFCETRVFLSNSTTAPFGDPGIIELDFDTSSGFHTYHVEVSDAVATLFIDGEQRLSLGGLGNTVENPSRVWLGDGTRWANSMFEVRSFKVYTPDCCPADLDADCDADADDFFIYLDAFAASDLDTCDIDGDGDCDADDFFDYLDLFSQGC